MYFPCIIIYIHYKIILHLLMQVECSQVSGSTEEVFAEQCSGESEAVPCELEEGV